MLDAGFALFWVALGSAVGGAVRFFVSGLVARAVGETFPWGTMTVNATGSFAIGAAAAAADAGLVSNLAHVWPVAVTGFLGSYTTVSSFSLQTLALVREGEMARAGGNVVVSVLLCLAGVALGFLMVQAGLGGGAP
jgi:fluoride exporter